MEKRLKKFVGFSALSLVSATVATGALGFGIYCFETGKEIESVAALIATTVGALIAGKAAQRAIHHKKVYNAKKAAMKEYEAEQKSVGVTKTLSSESQKQMHVKFFS